MSLVAKRECDKRLLKLIRSFLTAGILENGLVSRNEEGTPQGGPLSPILSNLMLDVLDRELESRKLHFVRYADDCNIYVRSLRAGQRVMETVTSFLKRKLKLKVNPEKSAVGKPSKRKFLGFSFQVSKDTVKTRMTTELARYINGWRGYFGFCQTPSVLQRLEQWTRNNGKPDNDALPNSQIEEQPQSSPLLRQDQVWGRGASADPCPCISRSTTSPSPTWDSLPSSNHSHQLKPPNRRVRTRTHGGVGGGTPRGAPYPDFAAAMKISSASGQLMASPAGSPNFPWLSNRYVIRSFPLPVPGAGPIRWLFGSVLTVTCS